MEYKSIELELKASKNDNEIEGYASIFDTVDSHKDIVKPGAFKKTISENKSRIKLMRGHHILIGVPTHLEEDSKGLYFKGKISDTDTGRDTLTLIKDGVLTENSIGYKAIKYAYEKDPNDKWGYDPFRLLQEVKLVEISVVTWGSNENAKLTGFKSDEAFNKLITKMEKFYTSIKGDKGLLDNKEALNSFYINIKSLLGEVEPDLSTRPNLIADVTDIKACVEQIEYLIKKL